MGPWDEHVRSALRIRYESCTLNNTVVVVFLFRGAQQIHTFWVDFGFRGKESMQTSKWFANKWLIHVVRQGIRIAALLLKPYAPHSRARNPQHSWYCIFVQRSPTDPYFLSWSWFPGEGEQTISSNPCCQDREHIAACSTPTKTLHPS